MNKERAREILEDMRESLVRHGVMRATITTTMRSHVLDLGDAADPILLFEMSKDYFRELTDVQFRRIVETLAGRGIAAVLHD